MTDPETHLAAELQEFDLVPPDITIPQVGLGLLYVLTAILAAAATYTGSAGDHLTPTPGTLAGFTGAPIAWAVITRILSTI